MSQYKATRNIEASILDYITPLIASAGFTGVSIEKTFANVSGDNLPVVLVRSGDTEHERWELGSDLTKRFVIVLVDIYCKSDGLKLDLTDYLVSKLKLGMSYYQYTITSGVVTNKTLLGRITVATPIPVAQVDLNVDKSDLSVVDRYHSLISLSCSITVLEN